MIRLLALFSLVLMWLAPAQAAPRHATQCDSPRPLKLALVPLKDPNTQARQYRPLIKGLEQATGRRVQAVPATSYGAVIEGLLAGDIDLAEMGPASYAIAMSRGAKIKPVASFRLQQGPATPDSRAYHSVLITRHAHPAKDLGQLRGSTLSLTDPASTSGAILPRKAMQGLTGVTLESYFSRITFAGSHDRSLEAVRSGRVDAAFVSSTSIDDAVRRGALRIEEIRILWRSKPIPYDPFVVRQALCPALQDQIRQVFLGNAEPLRRMLHEMGMTGFVPVTDEDYREIRMLYPDQSAHLAMPPG
ncbi:MAG: phosphate/phosphite/phosphonate ABC transporter substrate-binding protein [Aquabacterium sp.]|jgi:phosphonate transport system substrate-binding protein|uniref:phosphate/phosphite/phosphonate ABC transporter substrate-binding protein n=1 Tax=Aquabacterium sp. TaxID=1872578 RepID=UPI002A365850|nr:phosphate/phosphite/phosphonate ABC transporter substrate-binding protein [Aquabacterium sp.]MDX9843484.1 phosphate/phosphite/phosphonate ABC transporter substrate-binding protein [Aquabacterium sp.]